MLNKHRILTRAAQGITEPIYEDEAPAAPSSLQDDYGFPISVIDHDSYATRPTAVDAHAEYRAAAEDARGKSTLIEPHKVKPKKKRAPKSASIVPSEGDSSEVPIEEQDHDDEPDVDDNDDNEGEPGNDEGSPDMSARHDEEATSAAKRKSAKEKGKQKMTESEAEAAAAQRAEEQAEAEAIQEELDSVDVIPNSDAVRQDAALALQLQAAEFKLAEDHNVDLSHHDADLRNSGLPATSPKSGPPSPPAPPPPAVTLSVEDAAALRRAEINAKTKATKQKRKLERQQAEQRDAMDVDPTPPAAPKRKAPPGPSKPPPKPRASATDRKAQASSSAPSKAGSSSKRPRTESSSSIADQKPPAKKIVPARPEPLILTKAPPPKRSKKDAPVLDSDDEEDTDDEAEMHPTFGRTDPPSDS